VSAGRRQRPADLLEIRLVGTPELVGLGAAVIGRALGAGGRVERTSGPYPVRGDPALVRVYLRVRRGKGAPPGRGAGAAELVAEAWYAALEEAGGRGASPAELARAAGRSRAWAYARLAEDLADGGVVRVGRGRYAVAPEDGRPAS
jgi:hypothetical protein